MKNDVTICFRSTKETKRYLAGLAKQFQEKYGYQVTISQIINKIIEEQRYEQPKSKVPR